MIASVLPSDKMSPFSIEEGGGKAALTLMISLVMLPEHAEPARTRPLHSFLERSAQRNVDVHAC
jgi:hypothetical protein